MKCLIVTSRHGLLNWYPTFLLYAFSLSVLDLQFGIQLYFYNAVFHVVECGLEADQVSNFITRIQLPAAALFIFTCCLLPNLREIFWLAVGDKRTFCGPISLS